MQTDRRRKLTWEATGKFCRKNFRVARVVVRCSKPVFAVKLDHVGVVIRSHLSK
jgi:hypothetical protein